MAKKLPELPKCSKCGVDRKHNWWTSKKIKSDPSYFTKHSWVCPKCEAKDKKPVEKKKKWSEMGQAELNYQLNVAMDAKDWETVKEIQPYIRESLAVKPRININE